ncbi:MAG: AAA family ATPase [Thermoleophilia bacterium]|nr:AAA family ATPase [Thermoleophilia bacterium]
MTKRETVQRLRGTSPVDIGELNRQAAGEAYRPGIVSPSYDLPDDIVVTDEYRRVQQLLEAGNPVVFVTGNAGTGKSTLVQYLRSVLRKRLAVVAPTGVAALNVGGSTIHSFFRLPPKLHEEGDIKLLYDRKLYQKLELLIVDEVSMVRCDLLDSVDRFLRLNRDIEVPFGGVQMLLIGDLFQLPPVVPRREWEVLRERGYASPYFFSSFALQSTSLVSIELTSVFRQADGSFVDLLNRIRIGEDIETAIQTLNGRCSTESPARSDITLTCTNSLADQINLRELHLLASREYLFEGRIEGQFSLEDDRLPSPLNLALKEGARVMFTKNDGQRRWVNGTLGVVREVNAGGLQVQVGPDSEGQVHDVQPVTWEAYKYLYDRASDQIVAKVAGTYTQYPLMLAWAVTIHKSQGKTLDNVLVDFGAGAFASGQAYVALSRCRVLEGIRLARAIRPADIICDPVIARFYHALAGIVEP